MIWRNEPFMPNMNMWYMPRYPSICLSAYLPTYMATYVGMYLDNNMYIYTHTQHPPYTYVGSSDSAQVPA